MTFEGQHYAFLFFNLEEHDPARDIIQHLKEDDFAKEFIAPDGGIRRSSFYEAINSRGLEQLQYSSPYLESDNEGNESAGEIAALLMLLAKFKFHLCP